MKEYHSIIDIEKEIAEFKKHDIKTKQAKSKYRQLKTNLNQAYSENKNQIMQFESTNYNYLALMRSTHNYYKIFGHSALFYVYSIAPKLNITANLQPDGDFTSKSEYGFISIRDIEKLEEIFNSIKITRLPTKNQTGDFVVFKLPWTFTEKQLLDFIDENNFNMRKFNHVVLVDNILPILFIQLEELEKAIYENVRGMSGPVEREVLGYKLLNLSTNMLHLYFDLANGNIDKYSCLKKLKSDLNSIKYQVKIIADLKIWQPKTCVRIGDIIIKIQEIIIRETKN